MNKCVKKEEEVCGTICESVNLVFFFVKAVLQLDVLAESFLVFLDTSFERMDSATLATPNLLGNLGNQTEIVRNQDNTTVEAVDSIG